MTTTKFFAPALLITVFACNNPKTSTELPTVSVEDTARVIEAPGDIEECYVGKTGNRIVELSLKIEGRLVTGTLNYLPEQKDKNVGQIKGSMMGDTLLADYTFMSEGIESVREIIFLKIAGGFKEGYAAVKDQNGKMIFEDRKNADFSKSTLLAKVDCKKGIL